MSRCELTVKDDFRLTEKTMRTSHFKANAIMKAAVLAASILLFGVSASFGQQTVNLTAAPTTTTLPDGTTVPMWGYFCGTAVATNPAPAATCGALNPSSVSTVARSEEHTSELQSQSNLVCRLLLEKKKK